jgi:alkyldihydroxyacetonephosphate synthase
VKRRMKHWGWGFEDEQLSPVQTRAAAAEIGQRLGFGSLDPQEPVPLSKIELPPSRLAVPGRLEQICSTDTYDRCLHAYGRAYADVVKAFRGRFEHPPDVVARPRTEEEAAEVLDWALSASAAVIPFGGGTSVVGGVEPRVGSGYAGVVTIDVKALDRVLDVDPVSRSARIQAGATGPDLEAQLSDHGLTLRHFPQSCQF